MLEVPCTLGCECGTFLVVKKYSFIVFQIHNHVLFLQCGSCRQQQRDLSLVSILFFFSLSSPWNYRFILVVFIYIYIYFYFDSFSFNFLFLSLILLKKFSFFSILSFNSNLSYICFLFNLVLIFFPIHFIKILLVFNFTFQSKFMMSYYFQFGPHSFIFFFLLIFFFQFNPQIRNF